MRTANRSVRLALIATSPLALNTFFREQVRHLGQAGFRVHTISAPQSGNASNLGPFPRHSVPMNRGISPLSDLLAILRLAFLLRRLRPAIVHSHTPKAGLLGMFAATLVGVRIRVYTVNGLVWATSQGWRRRLLMLCDSVACWLATQVLCVSPSLLRDVLRHNICAARRVKVLGHGGSHGVDLKKFNPAIKTSVRSETRQRLAIPPAATVIAFFGRVVRDKGIEVLADAWAELASSNDSLHLLICGAPESGDAVSERVLSSLRRHPRVHFHHASQHAMPSLFASVDLCVLPTYREGLPNVLLEAAAMQVPVVATRTTGCIDVVEHEVSGLLFDTGDVRGLVSAVRRLACNKALAERLAQQARRCVMERYSETEVSARLLDEYGRLLANAGFSSPAFHANPGSVSPLSVNSAR